MICPVVKGEGETTFTFIIFRNPAGPEIGILAVEISAYAIFGQYLRSKTTILRMKKTIALVTGGYSGEAVISYRTATTIGNNLDPENMTCTAST